MSEKGTFKHEDFVALKMKLLLAITGEFKGRPTFVALIKKSTANDSVKDILLLLVKLIECNRMNKCNGSIECNVRHCLPLLKIITNRSMKLVNSIPPLAGADIKTYKKSMDKYKADMLDLTDKLEKGLKLAKTDIDRIRASIGTLASFIDGRR